MLKPFLKEWKHALTYYKCFPLEFFSDYKTSVNCCNEFTCIFTNGCRFQKKSYARWGLHKLFPTILFPQTPKECFLPPVIFTLSWKHTCNWDGPVWVWVGWWTSFWDGSGMLGSPPPLSDNCRLCETPSLFLNLESEIYTNTKASNFQLPFSLCCCLRNTSFHRIFIVSEVLGEISVSSQFKNRLNVPRSSGHWFNLHLTMVICKTETGSLLNSFTKSSGAQPLKEAFQVIPAVPRTGWRLCLSQKHDFKL